MISFSFVTLCTELYADSSEPPKYERDELDKFRTPLLPAESSSSSSRDLSRSETVAHTLPEPIIPDKTIAEVFYQYIGIAERGINFMSQAMRTTSGYAYNMEIELQDHDS